MRSNARAAGAPRGFTLAELLTVMAIVAMVAALTFPVFVRARESGRQTVCLSNLRQLSSALDLYRRQWDDMLPPVQSPTDTTWKDALLPLVSSVDVYRCPSNLGEEFSPTQYDPAAPSERRFPASYSLNVEPMLLASGSLKVEPDLLLLSSGWMPEVKRPDSVILLGETRVRTPYVIPDDLSASLAERLLNLRARPFGVIQTHTGRSNWLFADGHVASLQPKATLSPEYLWSDRPRFGSVIMGGGPYSASRLHPEYR
ncbi:MAG TPA: prepilin-type N-terminal cleavage/methylation domain-containing protein [Armatimonadota bacterium]|jgi:prepilin-type N-terminal cleavage/methylation domain-containing protein/prepilin-type processing-associated H-X9-DG protein